MGTLDDLVEAKRALHELMIGKRVATIQKDGRSVSFTAATLRDLRAYIDELEEALGLAYRRRPPARFLV